MKRLKKRNGRMDLDSVKARFLRPSCSLFAMEIIGQKWKLPILWYIADKEVIRFINGQMIK